MNAIHHSATRANHRRRTRRGSVYALLVMTGLLVTVIGVTALNVVRIGARGTQDVDEMGRARSLALSGIDLAMQLVRDPLWRTNYSDGVLASKVPLSDGTISITAVDTVDGVINNNDSDPVVLMATGTYAGARSRVRATLNVDRGNPMLEVALLASADLTIDAATVTSDQTLCANNNIHAKGATNVYADVAAAGKADGGLYFGTNVSGAAIRNLTTSTEILAPYILAGTAIDISEIPTSDGTVLQNGGFETTIAPWTPRDGACVLTPSTVEKKQGLQSVLVATRATPAAGPAQDVTAALKNGYDFEVRFAARRYIADIADARVELTLTTLPAPDASPATTSIVSATQKISGAWSYYQFSLRPVWTGVLLSATLTVCAATSTYSFYIDDATMWCSTLAGDRAIFGALLSPTNNPYGAKTTNAQGIYVINCAGQRLRIRDSRIRGTLVLLDPDPSTVVEGSVYWEPVRANYPALLVRGAVEIATSSALLGEAGINRNMNPTGDPYAPSTPGENETLWDTYPSGLKGIVYASGKLTLSLQTKITGAVLCGGAIDVSKDASAIVNYNNIHLNDPPPGFDAVQRTLQLQRGSFRPLVDDETVAPKGP